MGTPPSETRAPSAAQLRGKVERALAEQPITFEPESTQVTPHGQQTIVDVSSILTPAPETLRVEIVGYTEPGLGGPQRSEKLSTKRARAVADQLVQQGVSAAILHAKGAGTAPPGSGPARRVDITVQ